MRIQNKFLVSFLGLTLLCLCVFGVLYLRDVRQHEQQRLERKMELIGELLRNGSRDLLWNLDQTGVERLCRSVLADPEVILVYVADISGAVQVRLEQSVAPEVMAAALFDQFDVDRAGRTIGKGSVIYRRTEVDGRMHRVISLFAGLVAVLMGGLLATYRTLANAVTNPVQAIIATMKEVNAGNYRARLNLGVDDEFREVEVGFNEMVEGVEESHLRDHQNATKLEEQANLLAKEIEDHKNTGDALRQAQKMEAIARLSGGVAHDFNNLLTSILGFSAMAQDELDEHDQAYADIEQVIRAGERARDLTHQLLTLGRKRQFDIRSVDINALLTGLDSLLRRTLGEDVELVTVMNEPIGPVASNDTSLEQVIVNLAVNARDAMPKGGKLTISTEEVYLEKSDLDKLPDIEAGLYAKITVSDTGVGMREDIKAYVFEPFFTTKREGEGTGLGLSTVHSIIRQCKGAVAFDSERGRGTEFRIYLPIEVGEVESKVEVQPTEKVVGGTETVLIVEDEDSVRRLGFRILGALGYTVLQARYGTEGLHVARSHKEPIHLVLSDVVMPQMSGPDMIREMKKVRNDFKVLYVSGFTQDRVASVDEEGRPVHLILKPFTHDVLARRVRDVLDEDLSKRRPSTLDV